MVDSVHILNKYFRLDPTTQGKFALLGSLYKKLNARVNVISRKDIDALYLHHILHSLAIAKVAALDNPQSILDLGTGGGFPGIPLALLYPKCSFTLIDGTRKKIEIVRTITKELHIQNVDAVHIRAEDFEGTHQYIVSRAVAKTDVLIRWCLPLLRKDQQEREKGGGLLFLKGGDLRQELNSVKYPVEKFQIADYFEESYFFEKYILFLGIDKLGIL